MTSASTTLPGKPKLSALSCTQKELKSISCSRFTDNYHLYFSRVALDSIKFDRYNTVSDYELKFIKMQLLVKLISL